VGPKTREAPEDEGSCELGISSKVCESPHNEGKSSRL
jgi:hypothetical protein